LTFTYQEALDYIHQFVHYGRRAQTQHRNMGLERMHRLLALLGNPQEGLHAVHIAGSKGKGSTAAMTEAILRAAGYKTGLYTSPHLHTFRERIRINGQLISRPEVIQLAEEIKPAVDEIGNPSTFELITAMAFLHFAHQHVDWAVLEVGLGGRLDATNVVQPDICAITPLSYEHTDLLGHTLSLIAWQKAGIIKAGVPVVIAPQADEARRVLLDVAEDTGVDLIEVAQHWHFEPVTHDLNGQSFRAWPLVAPQNARTYRIKLLGTHQVVNATTVLALIERLRQKGAAIPDSAIERGLQTALWPGRLEILSEKPALVVDSAHNRDSAEKLYSALCEWFPEHDKMTLIFGASRDKNISGMLEVLSPMADRIIVTQSYHPRAAAAADLVAQLPAAARDRVEIEPEIPDALTSAWATAGKNDLICVTGSIFVVAGVRETWARWPEATLPLDDWAYSAEPIGMPWRKEPVKPAMERVLI